MIKDIPVFEIVVDGAEGVIANAFTHDPANDYQFIAFDAQTEKKQLYFSETEERMVSGVLIAPDQKIFRRDSEFGEYYVFFSKDTIKDIVKKFAKNLAFNNTNSEHASILEGAFMVESWIVGQNDKSSDLGFDVPVGAWMATFFVENDELWNNIKTGVYRGFSVEGLFGMKKVQMSAQPEVELTQEEVVEVAKEVVENKLENTFLSILNDEKLTEKEKEEQIVNWLEAKK